MDKEISSFARRGWSVIQFEGDEGAIGNFALSIARRIAHIIPGIQHSLPASLKPLAQEVSRPSTLSNIFGLSNFPPHVDGSHLITPPRVIIIVCENPGTVSSPTTIHGLHRKDRYPILKYLNDSLYVFRNGRYTFYSSILMQGRPFIRFDQGCMEPVDKKSSDALQVIADEIAQSKLDEIFWRKGTALVIDNWRLLHSRGGDQPACPTRHLLRIDMR